MLGHLDGVILIGFFAGYIVYMVQIALKANREGKKVEIEGGSDEDIKLLSVPKSIVFIVGGAVAIAVGGDVTVDAAARIAGDVGMSQTLIGLTIVSIGTSLPELVTSIVLRERMKLIWHLATRSVPISSTFLWYLALHPQSARWPSLRKI